MVAFDLIKGSFEESQLTIERLTGVKIGARQALEIVKQCAMDFDSFYQETFFQNLIEEQLLVPIMVLTLACKGIVEQTAGLREQTRKLTCQTTHKLKHRLSKFDAGNRKRMLRLPQFT